MFLIFIVSLLAVVVCCQPEIPDGPEGMTSTVQLFLIFEVIKVHIEMLQKWLSWYTSISDLLKYGSLDFDLGNFQTFLKNSADEFILFILEMEGSWKNFI